MTSTVSGRWLPRLHSAIDMLIKEKPEWWLDTAGIRNEGEPAREANGEPKVDPDWRFFTAARDVRTPKLLAWQVYEGIVDALDCSSNQRQRIHAMYLAAQKEEADRAAVTSGQRAEVAVTTTKPKQDEAVLPPQVCAISSEAQFMDQLRALKARSGLSLRRLEQELRSEAPREARGRSALHALFEGTSIPDNTVFLKALLTVIFKRLGEFDYDYPGGLPAAYADVAKALVEKRYQRARLLKPRRRRQFVLPGEETLAVAFVQPDEVAAALAAVEAARRQAETDPDLDLRGLATAEKILRSVAAGDAVWDSEASLTA
ncbi:hypothetical protein [Amycolatopsis sp. ATCC 39116]|uniref:hypothetical protein n=1 Tax=Amycolatopsis sp. (strain ATCC 39116 / 75iv2) TaxID=385957 RepID=UPI00026258EE|nr:hypothetical protein [Amycolatopsis sp. ATCC 39116]